MHFEISAHSFAQIITGTYERPRIFGLFSVLSTAVLTLPMKRF
jgi:hypothetical protein